MNRKGFTLVELLAVIVIIAVLSGIAAISYTSLVTTSSDKVYENYMDNMHEAAIMYFIKNTTKRPTSTNASKIIYLSNLPIDKINNPIDINDYCLNDNSYVKATYKEATTDKGVSGIEYEVHLSCNRYSNTKKYTN